MRWAGECRWFATATAESDDWARLLRAKIQQEENAVEFARLLSALVESVMPKVTWSGVVVFLFVTSASSSSSSSAV